MNKTVVTKASDATIITIERTFNASRNAVFSMFTEAGALRKWWSPTGTSRIEIDARAGGAWKFTEEDSGVSFFGYFHEVQAPERIVQTGEFSMSQQRGHVVLERYEFVEIGKNKTKLLLTETFLSGEDREAAIKSGMEVGLAKTYEKIDVILQNEIERLR